MWFHYQDAGGGTGIGRAVKVGEGWQLDPRPALEAEQAGLRRLGCTSAVRGQQELRVWAGATDGEGRSGIFACSVLPGGGLALRQEVEPLFDPDPGVGLHEPSVLRDGDRWRLYLRRSSAEGSAIALYGSDDGKGWVLEKSSVLQLAAMDQGARFSTPMVYREEGVYHLWVAVTRRLGGASVEGERDRPGADLIYAVLYAASPDPQLFDLTLNPIVLKPGRRRWKAVAVDGPAAERAGDGLIMYFRGEDPDGVGAIGRGSAQFRPKSGGALSEEEEAERLKSLEIPPGHRPPKPMRSAQADDGELLELGGARYELQLIPAGSFLMGSPLEEDGRDPDESLHRVTTSRAFLLGRTEVTQELFKAVTGVNPAEFSGPRRPVEQVSWSDAVLFCNLLSQAAGLKPAYTGSGNEVRWNREADGYRLPTEAEWELAARAGVEGGRYAADGPLEASAWYKENSGLQTHPVGQLAANPWGLYDMTGNVYEWVWDRKAHYGPDATDPVGLETTSVFRAERGCSFRNGERNCRVANRGRFEYYQRSYNLGFRLARSP